jgi:hypothetical protein
MFWAQSSTLDNSCHGNVCMARERLVVGTATDTAAETAAHEVSEAMVVATVVERMATVAVVKVVVGWAEAVMVAAERVAVERVAVERVAEASAVAL